MEMKMGDGSKVVISDEAKGSSMLYLARASRYIIRPPKANALPSSLSRLGKSLWLLGG